MKSQYIISEEEYERIIGIISEMNVDLHTLTIHMDSYDHVKKYALCLSVLMGELGKCFE